MHSNGQNDLSAAFRTHRLVRPLQTMDGVITTRGSASRRRRDPGYAPTHTEIALCGAGQAEGGSTTCAPSQACIIVLVSLQTGQRAKGKAPSHAMACATAGCQADPWPDPPVDRR